MRLSALLAALLLAVAAMPAVAVDDQSVDLELILAVDISRSMDADEQRVQRQGYVNAFRHPDVIRAITQGARGRIAVTYVEWAGVGVQWAAVPWEVIAGPADSVAFADKIAAVPLDSYMGTSISRGLFFAAAQFQKSGVQGDRLAVDVSGDGPNNMGLPVNETRDWLVRQGVTINGLPIMLKTSSASPFDIPNLDVYYRDCVIGGPGAFMITVNDSERFETAIRRKLVLEISGLPARVMPAADAVQPPGIDCQIGEKTREKRLLQFNDH